MLQVCTLGIERSIRHRVSEPEPGRVLVEQGIDTAQNLTTTFVVIPVEEGRKSQVEIRTTLNASPGLKGLVERPVIPLINSPIYRKELNLLEEGARRRARKQEWVRDIMRNMLKNSEREERVSYHSSVAHFVSEVTNPALVALPTFLAVAVSTAPDIRQGLLWWIVTVVGISIAPLTFVLRGVRRGQYTDHHVSVREQRFIPLLFALICTGLVFVVLLLLHASRPLLATVVAVVIAGGCTLMITRYWKISLHLVGVAGAITSLTVICSPLFVLLFPLVFLVGWARWQVHAHTPLQACAGALLAASIVLGVFKLFGLY